MTVPTNSRLALDHSRYSSTARRPSRREILRGLYTGTALALTGDFWPQTLIAAQQPARLSPAGLPRDFSKQEYQRRWERVRDMMRADGFDCLILPSVGEGDDPSDVAYLTGTAAGWAIFPLDGPIIALNSRETQGRRTVLGVELRPDGRPRGAVSGNAEDGQWSPAIIEALRDRNMARARIGVGHLSGVYRNEEGEVSFTTLDRVMKALPQSSFASATELMMRAHLVKSAEEISIIESANAVAELGAQVMIDMARPGVSLRELAAKMNDAMLEASSEEGTVALDISEVGNSGGRMVQFKNQTLKPGQILNQEISGRVPAGYRQQVNHAVCIGKPEPKDWVSSAQYAIEAYQTMIDWIKPGQTGKDLCDHWLSILAKKGLTETDTTVIFHMGDGPRMGPNRREGKELVVEPGWVFHVVKSTVPMPSIPGGRGARFGDGVVVTADGARRIGKRKLEPMTLV